MNTIEIKEFRKKGKANQHNKVDHYEIEGIKNPIYVDNTLDLMKYLYVHRNIDEYYTAYSKIVDPNVENKAIVVHPEAKPKMKYVLDKAKLAIVTTGFVVGLASPIAAGLSACTPTNPSSTATTTSSVSTSQEVETTDEVNYDDNFDNMTFEQLDQLYKDNVISYDDYIALMCNALNKLNNSYFSSIGDGTTQLFITPDELRSFFNVMNADVLTAEEFEDMYGNNSSFIDPKEDGENTIDIYEYMTKSYLISNFKGTSIDSGISSLFLSKDEKGNYDTTSAALINEYESKLSAISTATTTADKKAKLQELIIWVQKLKNFDQAEAVSYNGANQNAQAYIYSTFQTYLVTMNVDYNFNLLDKDNNIKIDGVNSFTLDQITTISGTEHCALVENLEDKYNKVAIKSSVIESAGSEEDKNKQIYAKELITAMFDNMYSLVKENLNRNVQIAPTGDISLDTSVTSSHTSSNTYTRKPGSNSNAGGSGSTSGNRTEVTRNQAVNSFGESTVSKVEEEARSEVDSENKHAEEQANKDSSDYNNAYKAAYENAAATGTMISIPSGASDYYRKGATVGYKDGLIEYNAKKQAESQNNSTSGTVTEEKPVTNATPVPGTNEQVDPNRNQSSDSQSTPTTTTIPGGQVVETTTTTVPGATVSNPTSAPVVTPAPTVAPVVTPAPTAAPIVTPAPTSVTTTDGNTTVTETPITNGTVENEGEEVDPDFYRSAPEESSTTPVAVESAPTSSEVLQMIDEYANASGLSAVGKGFVRIRK